jgi:hypothetical protein
MPRAPRIWPVISLATTLLILFAIAHLAAQKRVTESSNDFGKGTTINKDYNPDGTLYREEYLDAKGRLRKVVTYSYDADTKGLTQKTSDRFREDGTLEWDWIYVFDQSGKLVKSWIRFYDPQSNQTLSTIHDAINNK